MTLSTVLILYIVGVVITFLFSPIILEINKGDDLLIASLLFPLVWFVIALTCVMHFAQMYIDFLEKRNEKDC